MAITFRIPDQIVLMIFFCRIEYFERTCFNGKWPSVYFTDLVIYLADNDLIRRIIPIDSGPVPCPAIISLTILQERIY